MKLRESLKPSKQRLKGNKMVKQEMNIPKIRFKGFEGEWEEKALDKVATIVGGGTPDTKVTEYWNGDINWFSPVEIGKSIYAENSTRKITKLGLQKSSAKILPAMKTILFTSRAGIGDMAILKVDACTNQGFQSLIVKDGFDVYFIYSMGGSIKQQALRVASGSTFLEISGKALGRLIQRYPVFEEQTAIGNFFQQIDKLIELQTRAVETAETYKKAMLQKMFPQKGEKVPRVRFEGFSGDWEEKKVGEIFRATRGQVLAVNLLSESKTEKYCYPVYSSQTKDNGLLGYYFDFLFEDSITWTTDGANAGTVKFRKGKFYSTNVNGVLLSEAGYSNQMVAEYLNTVAYKYVSRVGNPKLMNNVMVEIPIILPKLKEQTAIGNFFQKLDQQIEQQRQKLATYQQLKKAMLQRMFV